MTLAGEGVEGYDYWRFEIQKSYRIESSCIVIYFSFIYLIIDGKRSFVN